MAVRGDTPELVIQSGAGLACEPENAKSIAETVIRFARMSPEQPRDMGEAAKRYYDEHLSLKTGVTKFEEVLARVCGGETSTSKNSCPGSACTS
jgi:glycosyltransferase involved in cell wall biosynthesis